MFSIHSQDFFFYLLEARALRVSALEVGGRVFEGRPLKGVVVVGDLRLFSVH